MFRSQTLTPRSTFWLILLSVVVLAVAIVMFFAPDSFAALDVPSLITSTDFDVPKNDVKTAAMGVLSIFFAIFVVGLIIAVFSR